MIRLTVERARRGWSKAKLARLSELDPGLLGKFESGRTRPYPIELRRLANALGFADAADRLLDEEGHQR